MSEEIHVETVLPKKKKKYIQKYKTEWEWQRPWLKSRGSDAYCTLCGKTLVSERYNIERHENSNKHVKREKLCGDPLPDMIGKPLKDEVAMLSVGTPTSLYVDYLTDQGTIAKTRKVKRRDSGTYQVDYLNDCSTVTYKKQKADDADMETTANYLEEYPQDDTLIYGKVWAAEFKELNKIQRIYAKRAIDEVLYQGRLDNLTSRSWNIPIENDPLERAVLVQQGNTLVDDQL